LKNRKIQEGIKKEGEIGEEETKIYGIRRRGLSRKDGETSGQWKIVVTIS